MAKKPPRKKDSRKRFAYPDTGEVVLIPPVSAIALRKKIRRRIPEPNPPVLEVNYGDDTDPDIRLEINVNDPGYKLAMEQWTAKVEEEVVYSILDRVALYQELTPDQKDWCDKMRHVFGKDHQTDEQMWFYEKAMGSDQFTNLLVRSVVGIADPTEGGIAKEQENFQDNVAG